MGSHLVLPLGDMTRHEQIRVFTHLLFVHSLNCGFGGLCSFEGDVALVGESGLSVILARDVSRLDFAKLGKHCLQRIVVRASR